MHTSPNKCALEVHTCIHVHVCIHVCIYIHVHVARWTDGAYLYISVLIASFVMQVSFLESVYESNFTSIYMYIHVHVHMQNSFSEATRNRYTITDGEKD